MYKPDDEKMKELILYISDRCENDPTFGAVKLNKILFFSDFLACRYFGTPITGQEYQALPQGPAPRRLLPLREELIREQKLFLKERQFFGYEQRKPIACVPPSLDRFTPQEIDIVNRVIEVLADKTASEVSELSHQFPGWSLADMGETIPYAVAHVSSSPPTESERAHANNLLPDAKRVMGR